MEALIGTPLGAGVRARMRGCELHAPIVRHPLAGLLVGTWAAREQLRLVDALYVQLSGALTAALLTTDARLSRACAAAELLSDSGAAD